MAYERNAMDKDVAVREHVSVQLPSADSAAPCRSLSIRGRLLRLGCQQHLADESVSRATSPDPAMADEVLRRRQRPQVLVPAGDTWWPRPSPLADAACPPPCTASATAPTRLAGIPLLLLPSSPPPAGCGGPRRSSPSPTIWKEGPRVLQRRRNAW
nr:unnamed protein product [Digitaria exilis]